MLYKGSCHCGRVAFEVEGEIKGTMACNSYEFNKHVIKHRFCPRCGVHPYGEGTDPKGTRMAAVINLRCIEGLDLAAIPVQNFDGRSL